jgi:hypothetical protein
MERFRYNIYFLEQYVASNTVENATPFTVGAKFETKACGRNFLRINRKELNKGLD